uniref:Sulfotransferase n=1 Tax=Sander lucioperca TaxID=283035 RepID=A0A8C9XB13_SANLU
MTSSDFVTNMQSRMQMQMEIRDEDKLYRYNGVLYPRILCPEESFKALENIEAREDDVMLVAYPKCGFNWMVGVLRKIIAEATGMKIESNMPPLIEFFGPDVVKVLDETPSPRLLGTHLLPDNIPKSFNAKKTKTLVIFRNPKDTLVSSYYFYDKMPVPSLPWDTFYSNFLSGDIVFGSYFDHALAWEKRMDDPNVMIVTYEELKQVYITHSLCFFLTEAQVQQIAEGSTFSAMKEKYANMVTGKQPLQKRSGEVGDWKNHFTPEQSQEMDDAFNKHLAGTRLGDKLNYQLYCQ